MPLSFTAFVNLNSLYRRRWPLSILPIPPKPTGTTWTSPQKSVRMEGDIPYIAPAAERFWIMARCHWAAAP